MPKGIFTQGVALLLSRAVTLDEIEPLLADFKILRRTEASKSKEIAGPGLTISFRPEANGVAVIDLQNERWPDHMGDPKDEPMLFAAWTMGHYAPYTFPGNLDRAVQQAWTWKEAGAAVAEHQAYIRIKVTYVGRAKPNSPVLPSDYQAEPELQFLVRVATALAAHPAVVAYFNPAGEVLRTPAALSEELAYHQQENLPSLGLWSNARVFNPNNGWLFMDTIGMEQLDIPDQEACFRKDSYDLNEVGGMLRNICLYRMQRGDVFKTGNTMDGAGGVRWRVFHVEESLAPRPRQVLRWFPEDGETPPMGMQPPLPRERKGFLARVKRWIGRE
jgi:hypothetical protein